MQPIFQPLHPVPDVVAALRRFQNRPGCLLLDSSLSSQTTSGQSLGRYSFLMADPVEWIEVPVGSPQPLGRLREILQAFRLDPLPELPPMQGGVAGMFGYDLNQSFEKIHPVGNDPFRIPAVAFGCYDVVVAWDHFQKQAWVISTGIPETEQGPRLQRARARLEEVRSWLHDPVDVLFVPLGRGESAVAELTLPNRVPVGQFPGLTSDFSAQDYVQAVQRCIDYIRAGDAFQINLAQQLLYPASCPAVDLYEILRRSNPAPFAGYFDTAGMVGQSIPKEGGRGFQVISSSPERLVAVRDRVAETRPIKGTRRRTGNPVVDIYHQQGLLGSEKERAENVMIVDLMRNDFSRCCTDDSVVVTQLCELEQYPNVMHLVSAVQGKLQPEADLVSLVEAIFPGGSVTGAPKVRAMEIIAELERNLRGAYCGSLGYLAFNGEADLNILIRTVTAVGGWWQIPVGGGIVSQSNPPDEYNETWTKAAGMLKGIASLSLGEKKPVGGSELKPIRR
jgi:para-aminobenzoate synthetase component 1